MIIETSQETYTVSELTTLVKKQLEMTFSYVRVKGEVTSLRKQASGHIYFSLKDASAQVACVLFQGSAKLLKTLPKEGDQIVIEGSFNIYAPRGTYQIVIKKLDRLGVGDLLLKLHQLKTELATLGWLDKERKKPLPFMPKTIGVVTSPTGAVIQDILHVLERRLGKFSLILNPVLVQGEGAAADIAKAIGDFNRFQLADVLIVGRGGGSLEDLWPFNEKCVAEAIYHSKIPVVSAVGHETDFSIADFVADVRAPTPSAAAEIVSKERSLLVENLRKASDRLQSTFAQLVHHSKLKLDKLLFHPLFSDPSALLLPYSQKMDDLSLAFDETLSAYFEKRKTSLLQLSRLFTTLDPIKQFENKKENLLQIEKRLQSILSLFEQKRQRLKALIEHLQAINPKNILQKGYCICFHENTNSVIMSKSEVDPAQTFDILFHDGKIRVTKEKDGKTNV